MGNLLKDMSYSEVTATLELFDFLGVEREHFYRLRANRENAAVVVRAILGEWPVWKTITIGGSPCPKTADLVAKGFVVPAPTADLLDTISSTDSESEEHQIELVRVPLLMLGLSRNPSLQRIYNQIGRLGLDDCPPKVAIRLRQEWKDQPSGDSVAIGTRPIFKDGKFHLLYVARGIFGELLLTSAFHSYDLPDYGSVDGFNDFIFVRKQVT